MKTGEFCKTRNFLGKNHGICNIDGFLNGEFLKKHGIFLGNSRRTLNGEFLKHGSFEKSTEFCKSVKNA